MPFRASLKHLADVRRRATDIARDEAVLRADVEWVRVYAEEYSRVYDETLAELLAHPGLGVGA
jgi:hypothetical protein